MKEHPAEYLIVELPVGPVSLLAFQNQLIAVAFTSRPNKNHLKYSFLNPENPVLQQAAQQIKEYFQGKRTQFQLPLLWQGTDFQIRVWQELVKIPYGKTISYQQLALQIGNARATRAVAQACAQNPLPIIVPCHRVIRKDGSLGGYAAGLPIKKFLLQLEKRATP